MFPAEERSKKKTSAFQLDFDWGILEVSLPQQPREADIATERHPGNSTSAATRAGE